MDISDFIEQFYEDAEYQKQILEEVQSLKSNYDSSELLEHQKVLDTLHYEMLFNRINNEIYPKKLNINLMEKEI